MNIILYILIYLICSTVGLIFLKSSLVGTVTDSYMSYFRFFLNFKFIVGFLLYLISFIIWIILLSRKDLSYIYPIVIGLSYLVIMISALVFLNEELTVGKIIGATFVCLGIIIIFLQK